MTNPKISVIIPVYNTEKYLTQCLDSVINQTLSDIEILVINDRSPDNCQQILKEYEEKDSRLRVITNEQNLGLGGTRNVGISLASAQYITFLDSDDWLEITAMEECFDKLEAHKADMALYRYFKFYEHAKHAQPVKTLHKKIKIQTKIFTLNKSPKLFDITSSCMKVYRKKIIDLNNIKFPTKLYYEDVPFSFQFYINMNHAVLVDKPLYYYRQHDNTITQDRGEKMLDMFSIIKITDEKILEKIKDKKIKSAYSDKKINLILNALSRVNKSVKVKFLEQFRELEGFKITGKSFFPLFLLRFRLYGLLQLYVNFIFFVDSLKFKIKILLKQVSIF
ncbi:glycosyltransferase family 2 protein [uncultured Draconibacterium sp.]|uniref:glycosyltransferase family 2 protein n=1 Tax=uncultured Draconibacterium sp. TaxID=1573823 RepID=UPI002AA8D493|nr:glycosyltransferase family 2 protein [uncultured Draconibacterium sp.]